MAWFTWFGWPYWLGPKKKNMFGLDISHYQESPDWNKVKTNNPVVDFVFLKASQGVGYTDPRVRQNSLNAKAAGIPLGYYHYASLNNKNTINDAQEEALYFISVIKSLPKADLPLILDLEDENPKIQLDDNEVLNWVKTFFATLHANGYTNYALYSYTPFLDTHLPINHGLGNIKLWIAQYTSKPEPRLPKGWSDYWIWQYSAKGKINGIVGDVDLNRTKQSIT